MKRFLFNIIFTVFISVYAVCQPGTHLYNAVRETIDDQEVYPVAQHTIECTASAGKPVDGYYILKIKDVANQFIAPFPIYGYTDEKGIYGGNNLQNVKKQFINLNPSYANFEIQRTEKDGLIIKVPENFVTPDITLNFVSALNVPKKNGVPDWCINDVLIYKVTWLSAVDPAEDLNAGTEDDGDNNATGGDGDKGGNKNNVDAGGKHKTNLAEEADSQGLRVFDWILLGLIVAVGLLALMRGGGSKNGHTEYELEKFHKRLDKVRQDNHDKQQTIERMQAELSRLNLTVTALDNALQKFQKQNKDANQGGHQQHFNQRNVDLKKKPEPKVPQLIGNATAVTNEPVLQLTDASDALFTITRQPDGMLTYTLVDSAEVLEFFSTNKAMLEIYQRSGVIAFDTIPQNARLKSVEPGSVSEVTAENYRVVLPMKLIFDV